MAVDTGRHGRSVEWDSRYKLERMVEVEVRLGRSRGQKVAEGEGLRYLRRR